MKKLIVAFGNFAKAPDKCVFGVWSCVQDVATSSTVTFKLTGKIMK